MAQGEKRRVAGNHEAVGEWAGMWAALPPSVASRETPQHMPPGVPRDGALRAWPALAAKLPPPGLMGL